MPYSINKFYVGQTYQEISKIMLDEYNDRFDTNYTISQFIDSDEYHITQPAINLAYGIELALGSAFDNMVANLKSRQDLEIKPKGVTYIGLVNVFNELILPSQDKALEYGIGDPNLYSNAIVQNGTIALRFLYEDDQLTEDDLDFLALTIYNNRGAGIKTIGEIETTVTSPQTGIASIVRWDKIILRRVTVALQYRYSLNSTINNLLESEMKSIYFTLWNDIVKIGRDIEPAVLNNILEYPSLSTMDSTFTVYDSGGENPQVLGLNEIIGGIYTSKFTLDFDDISISEYDDG